MLFKNRAKPVVLRTLIAGGLLAVGVASVHAQTAAAPAQAAVVASAGKLRLQIEARVGAVANMTLSSQGNAVRIDLRNATRDQLNAVAQSLQKQSEVKSARAVVLNAREAYIWVELSRAWDLVDQTIVAAPNERSRWELLLGQPGQGTPTAPVELKDIQLVTHDDLLDIRLAGSADLTAEVSIFEKPARVVVELPGATPASVERYVANFRPGPAPLIKRVSASTEGGVPRVTFELFEEVDLVDSDGVVADGQGRIRISLAADRTATAGAGALGAINARLAGRQIDFSLAGVSAADVRSYALEDPPRLVMDVLGLPPAQAQGAIDKFQSPHPGVLGARVESTRLGSARLVFDLSSNSGLVARGGIQAPVIRAGDTYTTALRTPLNPADAGYVAVAPTAPAPVSISQRGPRVDASAPLLVIRPVSLYAVTPPPATPLDESSPGLMGLLARAMQQDPRYLAARKDFQISAEAIPQARAGLLPSVSADYQFSNISQDVKEASNATFPTGASRYDNKVLTLSLTQPLVKLPAVVKLDQAQRSVEQARFNLMAAEQDLILRLASAYLNVSAATDGVDLANAERTATEQQFEQGKARLSNGLSNVTQVYDAEARFGLARARELEAKNRLDDARQGLKEILGQEATAVKGFKGDFTAAGPVPAQVEPWVAASIDQNTSLLSRRLAVEIASMEIRRQQAGYAPTVNLVASSTRTDSGGSLYGGAQRYNNNELGVRINMPLYEGGMTNSLVREAVARQEKTQNEYDQELRKSERQARAAFNGVVASLETQDALRKAVVAQQSALESREEGMRSGLYTPVAVIDSYRLYYTAKRDYLQARYDYLMNRLKLKQAVGILSRGDLDDLNAMLEP